MTERKMRSGLPLLAGLVLASGAWGQTTTMTQSVGGNITLASEFFGAAEGRTVTFFPNLANFAQGSQPYIGLTIGQVGGAGELGDNNSTRITFTLAGASFAAPASGADLRYFEGGNTRGGISVQLIDGGARGDTSVTYEVETNGVIDPTGTPKALYFFPPSLQVVPRVLNPDVTAPNARIRGVTVVASLDGSRSQSSDNPFPRRISGTARADATGFQGVNPLADGEILRLAPALTASLGSPSEANVDIENRKALANGLVVRMSGGQRTSGLKVGDLSIEVTDRANAPRVLLANSYPADLTTTSNGTLDRTLAGTAEVTVTGPFQEGDRILLGTSLDSGSGTKTTTASGGSATVSVPIDAMDAMPLVYLPGGIMDLRPGVFRASLALDFNDDANDSRDYASSSGTVRYAGVTTQAYAHGVSRANDLEVTSLLRLTCASVTPPATGCNVFLSCNGEDGADYFGDLTGAAAIPSGGTGVYSSGQIASALSGGWREGAGRCDLMSNGVLEVQHMLRTSGLTLHNNSVVVGRTRTNRIGLLRSRAILDGSTWALVSLGPGAPQGSLYLLSDGRFYGTLAAINHIADQWGRPSSTRLNAPPSFSGGGFQPMDHEPGCAFFELDDITVTPTNCLHDAAPELMGAIPLMNGDFILQFARAVIRPTTNGGFDVLSGSGPVPVLVATTTGFVLSTGLD